MGTRGLTCVVQDGKFKVAQYGQWDNYPEGQGTTILNFLKTADLEELDNKVANCYFGSEKDIERAYESFADKDGSMNMDQYKRFKQSPFAYLSRDTGGEIFAVVMASSSPLMLEDQSIFAGDSLFCEWAYVVDLDKEVFEVYRGFHEGPAPEGERFAYLNESVKDEKYGPVRLAKSFPLNDLPTVEDFVAAFNKKE